jgi:hypothetical protein
MHSSLLTAAVSCGPRQGYGDSNATVKAVRKPQLPSVAIDHFTYDGESEAADVEAHFD